jgi:hypothetical protein
MTQWSDRRKKSTDACTVTGLYRYAEEEGLIAYSTAVHVRRPRIDYESNAIGLDRNEVEAAGEGVLWCVPSE